MRIEVNSDGDELAQVADKDEEMIATTQVPYSPTIINAQEHVSLLPPIL